MSARPITFIAEIGLNHNGNFGLFFELIKQAARAGADFAKFQLGWRSGEGEINQLGKEEINLIFKICEYHNIKPMFSIFTEDAWQMAQAYDFAAFKIASRTLVDNKPLADKIAKSGKTVFASLGMTDEAAPLGNKDNVRYLWCKSAYPALPWALSGLPKQFEAGRFDGYSDHSVGIEVPLMAIVRGASIIEKHFTLDKSDTTIRDHALSASPDEFSHMVKLGRSIKRNLDLGV